MNWLLIKAVFNARRKGLLHLRPATEPIRLDCLAAKCAKCCINLGSPVVSEQEAEKIDAEKIFEYKNAKFIKSENCTCCLLENNLCSIYPDRPSGCREYPFYNIDGRLYYDAGCPGLKTDIDSRPDINQIKPFERFFPNSSKFTLWLIKKICTT
jgi:Fe-S-cluster containining protein